jgi:hypothetical protein
MRLNADCVRDVMLFLEENLELVSFLECSNIEINYTSNDVTYTCAKLIEAGYLIGNTTVDLSGHMKVVINSITWNGHQFLDNVRSNTVWNKTKETAIKLGSVSVSFLSNIAAQIIANVISGKIQI